jgi:anti-sigma factor RsiW
MLPERHHGRPLTGTEQKRLDELARRLSDDDPQLAAALQRGRAESPPSPSRPLASRKAVAVAAVLVVLATVLGGVVGAGAMLLVLGITIGVKALVRRARS